MPADITEIRTGKTVAIVVTTGVTVVVVEVVEAAVVETRAMKAGMTAREMTIMAAVLNAGTMVGMDVIPEAEVVVVVVVEATMIGIAIVGAVMALLLRTILLHLCPLALQVIMVSRPCLPHHPQL